MCAKSYVALLLVAHKRFEFQDLNKSQEVALDQLQCCDEGRMVAAEQSQWSSTYRASPSCSASQLHGARRRRQPKATTISVFTLMNTDMPERARNLHQKAHNSHRQERRRRKSTSQRPHSNCIHYGEQRHRLRGDGLVISGTTKITANPTLMIIVQHFRRIRTHVEPPTSRCTLRLSMLLSRKDFSVCHLDRKPRSSAFLDDLFAEWECMWTPTNVLQHTR